MEGMIRKLVNLRKRYFIDFRELGFYPLLIVHEQLI